MTFIFHQPLHHLPTSDPWASRFSSLKLHSYMRPVLLYYNTNHIRCHLWLSVTEPHTWRRILIDEHRPLPIPSSDLYPYLVPSHSPSGSSQDAQRHSKTAGSHLLEPQSACFTKSTWHKMIIPRQMARCGYYTRAPRAAFWDDGLKPAVVLFPLFG